MGLSPTAELVAAATTVGHAIGAFNVITLEHASAIVAGAEVAGLPTILQISQNAVAYHGALGPLALATAEVARRAAVPVALHLDHVDRDELLREAPEYDFGSVMFDASTRPYDENVTATRAAAAFAHAHGLWLEAELGEVGGKGAHVPGVRTDPSQARDFVAATGVDALAVAVGSEHAMTTRTARLDHGLIARLRAAVPVPLVLHGSSGVPDAELVDAVRHGIVKVNIGTALNVAFTAVVRERIADGVDPRPYLAAGRTAMARTVTRYLRLLSSTGS